jgi:hypothetical protein
LGGAWRVLYTVAVSAGRPGVVDGGERVVGAACRVEVNGRRAIGAAGVTEGAEIAVDAESREADLLPVR